MKAEIGAAETRDCRYLRENIRDNRKYNKTALPSEVYNIAIKSNIYLNNT